MRYGAVRDIQLSLWPEDENAEMPGSAEKLNGAGGKDFSWDRHNPAKRAEVLIKGIKKSEIRRGGQGRANAYRSRKCHAR